nr:hypothetical protein [Tanacetum cinerariifolium]
LLHRTMATTIEQQVALDEALVPSAQRSPFFKAFLVTADVPEIYMLEFWATAKVHQHSIRFKMDTRKHIVDLEAFREMLHITDLSKMEQKKILIDKMEGNKSIQRSDEQWNLYKALVEAYDADKTILDSYGESAILKRRHEDDDDQEGPSTRSDRGSKRRRKGGEHASASTPSEPATTSAGRSTTGTQSRWMSVSESAFVEKPVQTTCQMEELSHPMFKTVVQGNAQSWISALAKKVDARSSFNELLDTPIDFSNFIMNQLGVDILTPELLAGPTYELMRGSCNSLIELKYHLEEFYGFVINRESALDVYSKRRIIAVTDLKIVEWHNYKHLDWISIRRDDDKIYKFKEGDFKRLRLQDIEDMLLLLI